MKNKYITILLVILFWHFVDAILYYYFNGIGGAIVLCALLLIVLVAAILYLIITYPQRDNPGNRVLYTAVAVFSFPAVIFYSESIHLWEKVDWKLGKSRREEIVSQINSGTINPGQDGYITLSDDPPLSRNGNKIGVWKNTLTHTVTVEFFIDDGLLDHYDAFTYSNDSSDIVEFNEMVQRDSVRNKKMSDNWYRLHH